MISHKSLDEEYELSQDMVIMSTSDLDGNILEFNQGFQTASGYLRDELLHQPHSILRHPDMPSAVFEDMWMTLSSGHTWRGHIKNLRKDGRFYWVRADMAPIFDEGEIVGYVSVRTPLTQDEKRSATRHLKWTDTLGVHISSQSIKSIGSPLLISILLVTAILANLFLGSLSTYLGLTEFSPLLHAFVALMSIMGVGLLYKSYRDNRPNKSTMLAVERLIQGDFRYELKSGSEWRDVLNLLRIRLGQNEAFAYDAQRQSEVLNAVFEVTNTNLLVANAEGKILSINKALRDTLSRREKEIKRELTDFSIDTVIGSQLDIFHANPGQHRAMLSNLSGRWNGIITVGGVNFEVNMEPIEQNGIRQGFVVEWFETTEREQVQALAKRLRYVMEATQAGIWDWDIDSGEIIHNAFWYEALGFAENELEASLNGFVERIHHDDVVQVFKSFDDLLNGVRSEYSIEYRMFKKDGSVMWVRDTGKPIEWGDLGEIKRVGGSYVDITYLKEHEKELSHIANHDPLTGLPNRRLMGQKLDESLSLLQPDDGEIAVILIDLDGFKPINDTHGHHAGDKTLIEVSHRLNNALLGADFAARLGGDEFVVIFHRVKTQDRLVERLDELLSEISKPIWLDNHQDVVVTASLGIAMYPTDGEDADSLVRNADQVMYEAKQAGKNAYRFFDATKHQQVKDYHSTLKGIREGFELGEFELFYQPKVNMRSMELVGAEALLRWKTDGHYVLPGEFLPTIEGSDLEIEVGYWVIETALQQLKQWKLEELEMHVSVNLSVDQLMLPGFAHELSNMLMRYPDVDAGKLELEILETVAIQDWEQASQAMEECKKIGVKFSLDDFGTGFSSLLQLRQLPVDVLKIDRAFIRDMLKDEDDLKLIQTVIELGNVFRCQVIAEGVETKELADKLVELGCELGQGFGIARPLPVQDFKPWLETWKEKGFDA